MSAPCLPVSHPLKRRRKSDTEEVPNDANPSSSSPDAGNDGFEDVSDMDASEYLSRVVCQAKKLPEFFVAKDSSGIDVASTVTSKAEVPTKYRRFVPIEGSGASLAYLLSGRSALTRPPSNDYLPLNVGEWTETNLRNFENLRIYLDNCREKGVGGKLTNRVAFPPMKDRAGWHCFCVGSEEAAGNTNSYFGDDYETLQTSGEKPGDGDDPSEPAWRRDIPREGRHPSVKLVSQMDQVLVRQVLSHLCYYSEQGWKLTAQRASWIYALLARLEKPIHRDDASTLFGFLKVLTKDRSQLNLSDGSRMELSRLNLLIVLIGVYFEQGANTAMSVVDDA